MSRRTVQKDIMLTSSPVKSESEKSVKIMDCRVVLKKLSTADILKCLRPGTSCAKPANPIASTRTSVKITDSPLPSGNSSHPSSYAPACVTIPPEQLAHYLNKTDHLRAVSTSTEINFTNDRRLIEMEKTFTNLKTRIINLEAVISDQREELDKRKRVWIKKQWKLVNTRKTTQKVKRALCHSVSRKLNSSRNQSLRRTSEPIRTFKSFHTSSKKRNMIDFSWICQNMDSNLIEANANRRLLTGSDKIQPQTAHSQKSEFQVQTILQNSHILNHKEERNSSESTDPELISIKRSRMIRTYSKAFPENERNKGENSDNDENLSITPPPEESISGESEPVEPAPRIFAKPYSQLFPENKRKKEETRENGDYDENLLITPPPEESISHECEPVEPAPRIFVKPYSQLFPENERNKGENSDNDENLSITPPPEESISGESEPVEPAPRIFVKPYSQLFPENKRKKEETRENGDYDENHSITPPPEESISRESEPIEPAPRIFVKPYSQLLAASPSAFPDDWFLKVTPSVEEPPIPRRGCCRSCYEFKVENRRKHCTECLLKIRSVKQVYKRDRNAGIPQCSHQLNRPVRGCDGCILRAFIANYNLRNHIPFIIPYHRVISSVDKENQQAEPGVASSLIYNSRPDETAVPSNSSEQTKLPKQISTFPDEWFLVVPDYANKPPTPHFGCCHSCYEYNDKLHLQHCETCWSKAERLKDNYLQDPNAPNPRCDHQLNLPMRGCEGCILRAFVVRYNLRSPDTCFPVPYNKVDRYQGMTGIATILQNSSSTDGTTQRVESAGVSNHQNMQLDVTPSLYSMPKQLPKRYDSVSAFPENWFQSIPEKTSELPTPRPGHCTSCYEFKRTHGIEGHCKLCRVHAKVMKKRYLDNPSTPLPKCTHDLNKPLRGCYSCSFRAYILTYNMSNPDEPFPIPIEKINAEGLLPRIHQNVKLETPILPPFPHSDTSDKSTSELRITSTQTLQCEPYLETTGFPDETTQRVESAGVSNHQNMRLDVTSSLYSMPKQLPKRYDSVSAFRENWFQSIPENTSELPTPRPGQCTSCYEFKRTRAIEGHCKLCRVHATVMKKRYLDNPSTPLPKCTHDLNKPFRGCYSCSFRAYILTYNMSNPDEPFPIPIEKINAEGLLPKNRQNVKLEAPILPPFHHSDASDKSTSELRITSIQTSQCEPYLETTGFPDKWFLKVPDNEFELPTPRHGCCSSCYEYSRRVDGVYCGNCMIIAQGLQAAYLINPNDLLPQCTHHLNRPMRGCYVCIIRAYILTYNRSSRKELFVIPYQKVHLGIPLHMVQQIIKPVVLLDQDPQEPSTENSPVLPSNISSDSSSVGDEHDTKLGQLEGIAGSSSTATVPIPFPDGWFQAVSSDRNFPPVPLPYHCFSCYQRITNRKDVSNPCFCETCRSLLDGLRRRFLQDSQTPFPRCEHQISQPMQRCEGCIVQHSDSKSMPDSTTTFEAFPAGWFLKVSWDRNIPPTPYPGYCNACYCPINTKFKLVALYCEKCRSKLRRLNVRDHANYEHPIPYCNHQLNQPMRGCEGCVVKAFTVSSEIHRRRPYF